MISQTSRDQRQTLNKRQLVKPILENHDSELEIIKIKQLENKILCLY